MLRRLGPSIVIPALPPDAPVFNVSRVYYSGGNYQHELNWTKPVGSTIRIEALDAGGTWGGYGYGFTGNSATISYGSILFRPWRIRTENAVGNSDWVYIPGCPTGCSATGFAGGFTPHTDGAATPVPGDGSSIATYTVTGDANAADLPTGPDPDFNNMNVFGGVNSTTVDTVIQLFCTDDAGRESLHVEITVPKAPQNPTITDNGNGTYSYDTNPRDTLSPNGARIYLVSDNSLAAGPFYTFPVGPTGGPLGSGPYYMQYTGADGTPGLWSQSFNVT